MCVLINLPYFIVRLINSAHFRVSGLETHSWAAPSVGVPRQGG